MKKKIFVKWMDALRSGAYLKTSGALKNEKGFCALGVLCDISGLSNWEEEPHTTKYQYLGQINYLPKKVAEWAGMSTLEASKVNAFLIIFNDNQKKDFIELASMLEHKYKKKEAV